jgi:hypothetical protein
MNSLFTISDAVYPAPPEAVPPAPREVVINRRGQWVRWAAWGGMLGVPNLILLIGYINARDLRDLDEAGRPETGRIVTLWSQNRGSAPRARYTYTVDGRTYTGSGEITPDEYRKLNPDAECLITYLPARPGTSCLGRPGPHRQRTTCSLLSFAWTAAGILGLVAVCLDFVIRRERSLARDGKAVVGKVIDNGVVQGKNGKSYWVTYQVTTPDGVRRTNWHYVPRFIWEAVPVGTRVTVLADPAWMGRHCPLYAFRYVNIAVDEAFVDTVLAEQAEQAPP